MGDSADTAREKQAAKKKPKPVPKKKVSPEARAFGAATAIFVPPELQEIRVKPLPKPSVMIKAKKETISDKQARQKQETAARERLRLGLKISTPTGRNNLDAVPPYIPPPSRRVKILGGLASMPRPVHDIGLGLGMAGIKGAKGIESWAGEVADVPGSTLAAIMDQSPSRGPRVSPLPIPPRVAQVGRIATATEPAFRPVKETAAFLGSEKGQEEIWGKSLVNLALHGDLPGSGMEAGGLALGVFGVLPFGKLTQLSKAARLAKAAGKIGAALPDSAERDAARAAISQRLGEAEANDLMLLLDNRARNAAKEGKVASPNDWYVQTRITADNAADFMQTPGAKTAHFQTGAGVREGLVDLPGKPRWVADLTPTPIKAGDTVRLQGGEIGTVENARGAGIDVRLEDGSVRETWANGSQRVVPDTETPVYKSDLHEEVAKLPPEGKTRQETMGILTDTNRVKPSEYSATGMKDFLESYAPNEKIPKADIEQHLSTSLNAYNLDEVVRTSNAAPPLAGERGMTTRYGSEYEGKLTVRDETPEEPYVEISMRLRAPIHTRIRKSLVWSPEVSAPYRGKGLQHWGEPDVIAHIRFHIITDNEGKKALLVDEIQSDWASQWRVFEKHGGREGATTRLAAIKTEIEEAEKDLAYLHENPNAYDEMGMGEDEITKKINALTEERDEVSQSLEDIPGPPPLGEKQMEAAVRRTIRYAYDAEVDRIIITRGDVQALRNTAYKKTPKGREVDLHDPTVPLDEQEKLAQAWQEDVAGMTPEEIKAYANDPAHRVKDGMAKTFFRLYGGKGEKGQIPKMFEREMGEQGVVKEGIFDGGYSDQIGGIKRKGEPTKMDGFVIEMSDGAKAKAAVPMSYYQTAPNPADLPKGAAELLADGTRVIHLFEGADVSTLVHELAHVSYADLSDVDKAILRRHFGNLDDAANIPAHEAYARALERYVYEGQAMSSELDGVFAKVKTWMAAVYQHVNNIGGHVHPEVKQVFDRMMVKQETPEQQLVRRLREAPRVRRAQEVGYSEERARRIANQFEEWDRQGGKEEFLASMAHLKGELPKEEFTAMQDLAPEVVDSLVRTIRNSDRVRPYQKVRAATAIIKATEGSVPTRSELELLDKIFGGQVGFRKVRKRGAGDWMMEIWNIPRAVSASLDLSAPFRQGAVAFARHPVVASRSMKPMVKAALPFKRGKVAYEDVAEDIATRPNAINGYYGKAKLATGTHADPHSAVGEEPFNSIIASHVPGVKHSERAYETFLHKLRADIFDEMVAKAEKLNVGRIARGKKPIDIESKEFLEGLGRYVNGITGRGTLPDNSFLPFEKGSDLLNAIFFSPRLLASRVNMVSPVYWTKLWKADPMLFRAQMQANAAAAATGVGILVAASQIPGVSVGVDPTSTNFGKLRMGDTRVDILAGFNPLIVLAMRLAMGKSTSSTTGKTQTLEGGFGKSSQYDILQRFFESKMSPSLGIARDVLKHRTFIGEPVTVKGEIKNAIPPMMIKDALEVAGEPQDPMQKTMAFALAFILGGFGVGFSSYGAKEPKSTGSGGSSGGGDEWAPEPGYSGDDDWAPEPGYGGSMDEWAPEPGGG